MAHSAAGQLKLVASPLRLGKTPPEYRLAPPMLGEQTDEILRTHLGLAPAEIARLRGASIIA